LVTSLDVADLFAVACGVLEAPFDQVIDGCDLPAARLAIEAAASGEELCDQAGELLHALVVTRPFPRFNDAIAMAAVLQLVALNGCRLDLDPEDGRALLSRITHEGTSAADVCAWVRARLAPTEMHTEEIPMFERFTSRAKQVVTGAQEEARLLQHNYIGTEHILLGLLGVEEGVAAKVLDRKGIEADAVRTDVVRIVGRGTDASAGHIPFTPRAKKVLELSLREAIALGHGFIGTEHVLLGLLREGEGVAAQILHERGVSLPEMRDEITRLFGITPAAERRRRLLRPATWLRHEVTRAVIGHDPERRARVTSDIHAILDENDHLHAENARLRDLLSAHGIDPDAPEGETG
jgi:hypothetical protein